MMKFTAALAIVLGAAAAAAQTTNFNQVPHLATSLNHFTVVDPVEPITMFAVADHESFDVEHRGNKLFIEPLKEGVATDLFIWTASRQLVYEIDPPGKPEGMNMLVRNAPPAAHPPTQAAAAASDEEIQRIASLVLSQDESKIASGEVSVRLEQVFHSRDQIYIRYSISNLSSSPFRVTAPDVFEPQPTATPISILSLRNHQLSAQTFSAFKATRGPALPLIHSELQTRDLAPGQTTTGVISIGAARANPPELFQFDFGGDGTQTITAEAVL
jgi:hypothetical protein